MVLGVSNLGGVYKSTAIGLDFSMFEKGARL
jgi:hypothetical protein